MCRLPLVSPLVLALLWTCLTLDASFALGTTEHRRARTAEVAALLDLQGAQASLGRPAMNGFVLGLQQADENSPIPLCALMDTKSDPAATESAARAVAPNVSLAARFTNNDSVLIAGSFFQRERVPLLSIGATDPSLPEVIGENISLTPFGDNTQAAAAAEFGLREFGPSVVIFWDSASQYTRTLPRYFRARLEELGGTVSLSASYAGGAISAVWVSRRANGVDLLGASWLGCPRNSGPAGF